ncbi:MAG: lipopolysaccharide biosynthesis protein [Candidatus Electrothrix sp. ATG2]|nr:lipopolysaccharide biosynthesis protein [Candidatus Electrothrix sp. ATG2]
MGEQDSKINKLFLSGVGWMGISKTISQVGTWVATILIARMLSPGDYGLVGMSGLLVGIITLVGDFGLNSSIIRKESVTHRELSALSWQFVLLGSFFFCLIYLLAPLGCSFWNEPDLLNLIRLSALSFFLTSLGQVPSALMQKKMRFKEYGFALSLSAIVGSGVTIILAYFGYGPYSLIFGTICVALTKLIVVFFYEPFRPQWVLFTVESKEHVKFAAASLGDRYLWWYYSNCDNWLASKFIGKSGYGHYSMAFHLASMPISKIASIINPVVLPTLSQINSVAGRERFLLNVLKYLAYVSFPVFVGFFWIADDLVGVLLGEKWEESVIVFKALSLIFPLRVLGMLNVPLMYSMARPDVNLKNNAVASIMATLAFAVGVHYGINGLAYAWIIFYPLFFIIALCYVSRVAGISLTRYFKNLKIQFFGVLWMSLAIFIFNKYLMPFLESFIFGRNLVFVRLVGVILSGSLFYCIFVAYFDRDLLSKAWDILRKRRIA